MKWSQLFRDSTRFTGNFVKTQVGVALVAGLFSAALQYHFGLFASVEVARHSLMAIVLPYVCILPVVWFLRAFVLAVSDDIYERRRKRAEQGSREQEARERDSQPKPNLRLSKCTCVSLLFNVDRYVKILDRTDTVRHVLASDVKRAIVLTIVNEVPASGANVTSALHVQARLVFWAKDGCERAVDKGFWLQREPTVSISPGGHASLVIFAECQGVVELLEDGDRRSTTLYQAPHGPYEVFVTLYAQPGTYVKRFHLAMDTRTGDLDIICTDRSCELCSAWQRRKIEGT